MAKILLSDDDADMREICSRLVTRTPHTLALAQDADEAVSKAAEVMPDLMLMDMRMPIHAGGTVDDQAGLAALARIRTIAGLENTPVIALTGHSMRNFEETILAAGCLEILHKPITNFADFFALLKRHLPG